MAARRVVATDSSSHVVANFTLLYSEVMQPCGYEFENCNQLLLFLNSKSTSSGVQEQSSFLVCCLVLCEQFQSRSFFAQQELEKRCLGFCRCLDGTSDRFTTQRMMPAQQCSYHSVYCLLIVADHSQLQSVTTYCKLIYRRLTQPTYHLSSNVPTICRRKRALENDSTTPHYQTLAT